MATKYHFSRFDQAKLTETCDEWMKEAASGSVFPIEVEQGLTWAKTHFQPTENDSMAYGVFPAGSNVASAICEVVGVQPEGRAKRGQGWMKMLRLRVRPAVDEGLFNKDIPTMNEALHMYSCALFGILKLKAEIGASTLKVYGRSSEQLNFLQAVALEFEKRKQALGFTASVQGRFLVISNS